MHPRANTQRYFLFAAALIVLSNAFSKLHEDATADLTISNSISIMTYCAHSDPQAQRLLYILTTFRDVIESRRSHNQTSLLPQSNDFTASLFALSKTGPHQAPPTSHNPTNPTSSPFSSPPIPAAAPAAAGDMYGYTSSSQLPYGNNMLAANSSTDLSSAPDEAIVSREVHTRTFLTVVPLVSGLPTILWAIRRLV